MNRRPGSLLVQDLFSELLIQYLWICLVHSPETVELKVMTKPVADPDFELRKWPGLDFLVLLALFPSVISSFFTQNKGGGGGLSPRSAT